MKITAFGAIEYDLAQLSSAKSYFRKYYQGPFICDQGVEQLIDVLSCYGVPGSWLDLGAGPSTLFWSIPLAGITKITCSDKSPEMLLTLRDFAESNEVPECYQDILKICGKDESHLAKMRKLIRSYFLVDALHPWHGHSITETFDLVTEFGCFGIAPSAEAFVNCIGYAKPAIRPDGMLIGANWIRSNYFVARYGGANDYLCVELITEAATLHDMELLHVEVAPIKGDPDYNAVLIWVMKSTRQIP